MVKSNKFDYTNRPNSGAKLGHIIANALEKEANKVLRDDEKQVAKTRKDSINGAGGSSDTKDATVHALDIRAPGKQLGDEGTSAMAAGLEVALRLGTCRACLRLVDLNLSDNAITTLSLVHLAPIITLAKDDLKSLDLSKNSIKVETTEEAIRWETFLSAFTDCRKLRRLDLSGNKELGARAIEILARLHIRERPVHPMLAGVETTVQPLANMDEEMEETALLHSGRQNDEHANFHELDEDASYVGASVQRYGLRSVPYLTLTDIALTDAGALWLSYVLEDHHYPFQLIDELNVPPPESGSRAYQQNAHFRGIDWGEKETALTRDGHNLLKKAESIRHSNMLEGQHSSRETMGPLAQVHEDSPRGEDADFVRRSLDGRHIDARNPTGRGMNQTRRGIRRASLRSSRTADDDSETTILGSIRKKIERSVIFQDNGASGVELWHCALRIIVTARILTGIGPGPKGRRYISDSSFLPNDKNQPDADAMSIRNDQSPLTDTTNIQKLSQLSPNPKAKPSGTYAARLIARDGAVPGEPEVSVASATSSPGMAPNSTIFKLSHHRKDAFSEGSDLQGATEKLDALLIGRDTASRRFAAWQQKHIASQEGGAEAFRDPRVASHLPKGVMQRVVRHVLTERERGIVSLAQFDRAFQWGATRENIATEQEWRRMADSAQVLTLLERIGCAAYDEEEAEAVVP